MRFRAPAFTDLQPDFDGATDVAIVGSGPYGLSLAAHLRRYGVNFRIFGPPMQAWLDMSPGMYLKSFDFAVSIWAPEPGYTFVEYCRARGLDSSEPCPINLFAEYGLWAQRELVPELERVLVVGLSRQGNSYLLTLETGERVLARRVVVAVGLSHFERVPNVLAHLPPELASHTAQHSEFSGFRGKEVAVIGAGQSALQAAALLHENEARPQLFVRGSGAWFGGKMPDRRPLGERLRYPLSVLGPGRFNWFLEHLPWGFHYLPSRYRVNKVREHLGPLGAWWLRDRVEGKVPVHPRHHLVEAQRRDRRVLLRFRRDHDRDCEVEVDHVIAGTGFEVNLDRLPFLDRDLASLIRRIEGAPELSRRFETSVSGLYVIGPASALSFGPLFRFVAGAAYAAPLLARHLARTHRPAPAWRGQGVGAPVAGE